MSGAPAAAAPQSAPRGTAAQSAPRGTAPQSAPRGTAGWVLLALGLTYAGLIYHGVGAAGNGPLLHWWQPRGLFFTLEAFDSLLAEPWLATLVFVLPAFLLFLGVAALTRSSVAATLALAAVGWVLLSCFYGLGGNRRAVWGFFGWRGSAVMVLFALSTASALLAPFLTRSWLRLRWPARLVTYVPIVVAVTIAIRDVTGTDPSLPFAISPWPVVPMFGLEITAAAIAGLLAMAGLVLAAAGLFRRGSPAGGALCLALAAALPLASFTLGFALGSGLLALLVAAAALQLAFESRTPGEAGRWLAAARPTTLGAALVALPLLAGQLLVERDYDVTRNTEAKRILDALDRYYARESVYPEKLQELVDGKDLDAIPLPQVGFGIFGAAGFTYQNFGTNYLLEFSAPRWVQCAYNPPYPEEDEDSASFGRVGGGGDEEPLEADDAAEGGSWSCPQKPPELW